MAPLLRLRDLLREAGACAYGISLAGVVPTEEWRIFTDWINRGYHAGMKYMENHLELRRDPRLLLDGAKSVISVAYNYRQPNPIKGLATYALGEDYHKALRRRLKAVVRVMRDEFGEEWRICIDSAPVLERYWAMRSGMGRRSPIHGNIIVPGIGSMVFLAEILTTLELPEVSESFAGAVKTNIEPKVSEKGICPTGALLPGGRIDARKCINYLTIECREELAKEENAWLGKAVFGCDVCQKSCAENRGPYPPLIPEFRPLPGLETFLRGANEGFDLSRSPLKRGFGIN